MWGNMKNSYNAVLWVFLLALFANAEEVPQPLTPLPNDSSLATAPDSSLVIIPNSSLVVVKESSPQGNSSSIVMVCEPEKIDYQKNLRMVAYLNPLQLFLGAAYNMFMLTSTIEKPLSLGRSVIIQPTIWFGSSDGFIADILEYEKLARLGSGVGIRQYVTDKGYGFYLQAIASAYYIHAKQIQLKEENDDYWSGWEMKSWKKVNGVIGEFMLYAGSAHKWQNMSFFYEGGLGLGYDGTDTHQIGYTNRLVANFNLGIGIPF